MRDVTSVALATLSFEGGGGAHNGSGAVPLESMDGGRNICADTVKLLSDSSGVCALRVVIAVKNTTKKGYNFFIDTGDIGFKGLSALIC